MALKTSGRQWKWPKRANLTSDLKSVTSITLASMCILNLTAIFTAFEVNVTSKWPRRSDLTSELNSVTSITYVPMTLWPSSAPFWQMFHSPVLPHPPQIVPVPLRDERRATQPARKNKWFGSRENELNSPIIFICFLITTPPSSLGSRPSIPFLLRCKNVPIITRGGGIWWLGFINLFYLSYKKPEE